MQQRDKVTLTQCSPLVCTLAPPSPPLLASHPLPRNDAPDNELKIVLCKGVIGSTTRRVVVALAGLYFTHMSHMSLCVGGRGVKIHNPFQTATMPCHVNHCSVCVVPCVNTSTAQVA